MNRSRTTYLATVLLLCGPLLCGSGTGAHAAIVYDDGGPDFQNAYRINNNDAVANSFTLGSPSAVTGVEFGYQVSEGVSGTPQTMTSVTWTFSTSAFGGTVLATGTAALSGQTLLQHTNSSSNGNQFFPATDVYGVSFAIPELDLPSGSAWLELSNGVVSDGGPAYWAESRGASQGTQDDNGTIIAGTAESFQLTDSTVVTEPASLPLLVAGLAGVALWRRPRRQ